MPLLRMTAAGLYCEAGGFHIDPCGAVANAVITHGHADHLTKGCRRYLTAKPGLGIVQSRLGPRAAITTLNYGEALNFCGVRVSFHPAGHIQGSAQIRVEHQGEVWVVTGDYKTTAEATCTPFEPVRCQTLITESTFGHPIFRWPEPASVVAQIHDWWRENQTYGKASFLYVYALGKAQRVLSNLDPQVGPIYVHPQMSEMNAFYQAEGVTFPETRELRDPRLEADWSQALFLLPPMSRWQQPCPFHGNYSTAFVSGWMLLPEGARRRRVTTGFALSDHADHYEILQTVRDTGAERVGVMHGYIEVLIATLQEQGLDAFSLRSPRCQAPPTISVPTATQLELFADDTNR
ncbi:ligase-associated DNA damage response exonuclease [bacterium]|nr:ligase-associated DNA damage response exonuclease [bacterium]